MKQVLKWSVPVDDQIHRIGSGQVAHVACQSSPGSVQVWTIEDADQLVEETRPVQVYGTGMLVQNADKFVGTAMAPGGLVWHVFEKGRIRG